RVRAYASAEAFLSEYEAEQVGVLIADVRMPGMSGLELQEQLLARKAPLPIVFITGHGDVPMAVSTMTKDAVDFLGKPFNVTDVRRPSIGGPKLQEHLIASQPALPYVFITGHADVPLAVSTMKKGAVDFLQKPYNESDLRQTVAHMPEHANRRVSQAQAQRMHA